VARTAYEQLAGELLSDISSGRYPVGERLPTESELCRSTGLSRFTVRQALRRIEDLGMISRRTRDGTRVIATAPLEDYQPVVTHPDDIVTLVERTKIMRPQVREIVADAATARRLRARSGSRWTLVEGPRVLRNRRDPPVCWSEQYLRPGMPGLDGLLRGELPKVDVSEHEVEQTISAALLDERMASALDAEVGPALVVTRRRRDKKGRLVSVGIHTHPADRYELTTVLRARA
jgi:DNA-binding GntR family transcriptional regulator